MSYTKELSVRRPTAAEKAKMDYFSILAGAGRYPEVDDEFDALDDSDLVSSLGSVESPARRIEEDAAS